MDFYQIERSINDALDSDFVPLENIIRDFSQDMLNPTNKELNEVIKFLEWWIPRSEIVILDGETMKPISKTKDEFLTHLKITFNTDSYFNFSHKYWFDKK